ncbi:SRPBCC family protein [Cohnella sp. REN36]|uniref:SRPBCC family protein n=1 Tax=Cohnella sp. REN36 TaxID=2887347 RepID=UPI00351D7619
MMTNSPEARRTDRASKVLKASPHTIYQAFVDPEAWLQWLPPDGMEGRILAFDAREGGVYRMALTYLDRGQAGRGKTSEDTDVVEGTFVRLIPDERIVQRVVFDSDDPAFAGAMTMTWSLEPVPEGTRVTIVCEDVPAGIRKEDHDVGLRSSLDQLGAFTE